MCRLFPVHPVPSCFINLRCLPPLSMGVSTQSIPKTFWLICQDRLTAILSHVIILLTTSTYCVSLYFLSSWLKLKCLLITSTCLCYVHRLVRSVYSWRSKKAERENARKELCPDGQNWAQWHSKYSYWHKRSAILHHW